MKRLMTRAGLVSALLVAGLAMPASAQVQIGQEAPDFTLSDTQGRPIRLFDFRGKAVVLEWVNPGCPFVRKHYESGNLPASQQTARGQGVVWLAISSTARSSGDYLAPGALQAWMQGRKAAVHATLMDDEGKLGRAYGARTTPHMYLIDAQGLLRYAGAIDSKPTANPADIATARNYVNQALAELLAGQPISQPATQAYGCSVKYAG